MKLTRPLVFLDAETTGTDPEKDRIVELAIVIVRPGAANAECRVRRFDPEMDIPPEATEVHGITDADVADEPRFAQCADSLLNLLEDADLAGFNLRRFDLPLLVAEFERCGKHLDLEGRALIDPLVIFHRLHPRDLAAAYLEYVGRELEGAHGAEADATAVPEILDAMLERHDLPRDVAELHAWMDETHPYRGPLDKWWDRSDPDPRRWVFNFGKHKGQTLGDSRVRGYLEWMTGQADMHPSVRGVARDMLFGRFG